MGYETLREELKAFYWQDNRVEPAKTFAEKCFAILDAAVTEDMSVTAQKLLQYRVIVREFEPVIFRHCPFYQGVVGDPHRYNLCVNPSLLHHTNNTTTVRTFQNHPYNHQVGF